MKTKSLPSLTDERMYHDGNNPDHLSSWSPYDGSFGGGHQQPPTMVKYLSTSRLDNAGLSPPLYPERPYSAHGYDTYQRQPYRSTFPTSQPFLPTDPWPRKNMFDYSVKYDQSGEFESRFLQEGGYLPYDVGHYLKYTSG